MQDRQAAIALWQRYNDDPYLYRHALAVESAMRHFAVAYATSSGAGTTSDEDPNYWGRVGLLHDIDYQMYPENHLQHAEEILNAAGYDPDFIRAVLSHGFGIVTNIEPISRLEKTLFAVDELCGFISACALVRPSKSILDIEVPSVLKKWKSLAFAAKVDRTIIAKGAGMLGISLENLIAETIAALRPIAQELGLQGSVKGSGSI